MPLRPRSIARLLASLLIVTGCAPAASPAADVAPPQAVAPGRPVSGTTGLDSGLAALETDPDTAAEPAPELPPEITQLWQRRFTPRLKRELWQTTQRYDAAYLFMVPLHAAFERRYPAGQQEFADHVGGFFQYRDSVRLRPEAQLSWLQYLYFVSRFTLMAATHDRADLIPAELPMALRGWVAQLWLDGPAWQWYRKPFASVRERLDWKLSDARGVKGHAYEKAILDQELLLFAIAADLRQYGRRVGSPLAADTMLREIDRYARRVYDARTVWRADSGWTFQPGIWRDHPDHRYECRQEKRPGLEPCATIMGAEDASHSHRLPLVLRSMIGSHPAGSESRAYYERLLWGLERQFFERVAVPPSAEFDGWRLRNFMDGRNGVYRWQYSSLGPNQGYGPYELSGVLLHGWWAFLPGRRADRLYRGLAAQFPLREHQLLLYGGPGKRAQEPSGILRNGTAELNTRLAAELRIVYGHR